MAVENYEESFARGTVIANVRGRTHSQEDNARERRNETFEEHYRAQSGERGKLRGAQAQTPRAIPDHPSRYLPRELASTEQCIDAHTY